MSPSTGKGWGWGISCLLLLFMILVMGLFYLKKQPKNPPLTLQGEASEIVLTVAGQTNHVVKVDGVWQLDPPRNMPLDQEVIADILIAAKYLKSRRTLAATPTDLQVFGLQSSMNMLVLRSGKSQLQMIYGHQTFDGADIYVRELGRADVFLVSKERISQVLKPLSALRDPYLFSVPAADVLDRIEVQLPGKALLHMVRYGLFWLIEDSQKKTLYFVDKGELDQLITALGSLRVHHFVGVPDLQRGQRISTCRFDYGGVQRDMSFFRVKGLLFAALAAYPEEVFQIVPEFESQLHRTWVAEKPFAMDRFAVDTVILEVISEHSSDKTRQEFHKKPAGLWLHHGKENTLWMHNFFVYLSALTRIDMTASKDVPSRASDLRFEYALFLRMGAIQSRIDIGVTNKKVSGDPVLRIRFMDRTMWVRDPEGQFVAHVTQMLGEK